MRGLRRLAIARPLFQSFFGSLITPAIGRMIRKDLQLFLSDRRAVIMSFIVPIAIASFFGSIFSGPSRDSEPPRVAVAMIDQDGSTTTEAQHEPSVSQEARRLIIRSAALV